MFKNEVLVEAFRRKKLLKCLRCQKTAGIISSLHTGLPYSRHVNPAVKVTHAFFGIALIFSSWKLKLFILIAIPYFAIAGPSSESKVQRQQTNSTVL